MLDHRAAPNAGYFPLPDHMHGKTVFSWVRFPVRHPRASSLISQLRLETFGRHHDTDLALDFVVLQSPKSDDLLLHPRIQYSRIPLHKRQHIHPSQAILPPGRPPSWIFKSTDLCHPVSSALPRLKVVRVYQRDKIYKCMVFVFFPSFLPSEAHVP
jgi:hypothetical protein